MGNRERGSSDAWTMLSALAAQTSTIRLGTLVSPVTFRQPAVLAKVATTVDHVSGGRVELGMGAGWWQEEHTTHGFLFPPVPERFERLEEQLEIVHGLFTQERFTFEGTHYRLRDASFWPKPVQTPHPPFVLGGTTVGPWMQRLIARWGDEFNTVGGSPQEVRGRIARARGALEQAGRAQASLTTSFMTWCYVGRTEQEWRDRVERARQREKRADTFEDYLAELEADTIVGTPDRAAARLREYAEAGVQRVMLNHELFDDLDMLEVLAAEVFPRVNA
jgi:alkanesulfonate monooxygenase SsuD/methylene tetrahydromethanopterin reductase-like flavin-dependent oxidoreductase (luciferase family)